MFVFDSGSGAWVAWDGGSGGGGGNVVVTSWTASETVDVELQAGVASVGFFGVQALDGTGAALSSLRSSALGNLGGLTASMPGPGLLTNRPGDWVAFSDPGAAVLATATRLAVAGKAHVITSIMANVLAVNAQTGLTITLADSSGNLASWKFPLPPTGQGRDLTMTGLNIVCTTASNVTVAFNAAPAAGNFESVCFTGYTL
jgi:hypothetical protein